MTSFNVQDSTFSPQVYLCVLYLSDNKQRLFLHTAMTDLFSNREVRTARRELDVTYSSS